MAAPCSAIRAQSNKEAQVALHRIRLLVVDAILIDIGCDVVFAGAGRVRYIQA